MYRCLFIARNNLKKKKGDVIVLTGLIAMAVLLLYVSINALVNMEKVVDKLYEECNTADYYMFNLEENAGGIEEFLTEQSEVAAFESTPAYFSLSSKYRLEQKEENSFYFLLESVLEQPEICGIYPEWKDTLSENEILLPYYFKSSYGCRTGDKIWIAPGGKKEYEFQIAGFVEDPLFANPLNMSVYKCYLNGDRLRELAEQEAELISYTEYKVKLTEGESSLAFVRKISSKLNEALPHLDEGFNFAFAWEAMRGGSMMMSRIGMGLVLAFAVLLIVVALVIIRFSIANFCEMNLKNLGILQAAGYTSGQLTGSFVIEMLLIDLLGSIIGLFLGGVSGPMMGQILASIMGMKWSVGFDWVSAFAVSFSCIVITLAIAWISARKYGRIDILESLRGGVSGHNFRKNYFPLEKSRQPFLLALGMKDIFMTKLKNLAVIFIVALLGFTSCTAFYMYQNFVKETDTLLNLAGMEMAHAGCTGEGLDELGEEIEAYSQVEKVGYGSSANCMVYFKDQSEEVTFDFWKEPETNEYETLLEGRLPQYDNEVVLTAPICEELGVHIGDVVYLKGVEGKKDYILTGIDQKINNMGRKGLMNYEGAIRLNGSCVTKQINIYAAEGITGEELVRFLAEHYPDREVIDMKKASEDVIGTVSDVLNLLCVILIAVTIVVVVLLVFLLVRTKVVREQKNYGIYKALGFTSGQLCLQTLFSNLPVMGTGALLGAVIAYFSGEKVPVACLSFCGIQKCQINTDPIWGLVTVIGICTVAMVVALLCCRGIGKIEPVKILTED